MTPLVLHLRRSIFLFVAPVLVLGGGWIAWSASFPRLASNADIAQVLLADVAILAPVIAGFAAWDGLRETRHGGAALLQLSARPSARIVLVQLVAGCLYVSGSYALIAGLLYLRASFFVLADSSHWLHLLIGWATLCGATATGYAVAGVVGHWWAAPISALLPLGLVAYAQLGSGHGLIWDLMPFHEQTGSDFIDPNQLFFAGRLLFLLGLLGAALSGVVYAARARRWITGGTVIASLAALVSGALLLAGQHSVWGYQVADVRARLVAVKDQDRALTLNILPTYRPIAGELLERWKRVQLILQGTPAGFTELSQLTDDHAGAADAGAPLRQIYLNPGSRDPVTASVLETVADLHTSNCDSGGTASFATVLVDFWLAGEPAEERASLRPSDAQALAALRALNPAESEAWMSRNFAKFADCTLEDSDLPR